jgi:hypothetical protein
LKVRTETENYWHELDANHGFRHPKPWIPPSQTTDALTTLKAWTENDYELDIATQAGTVRVFRTEIYTRGCHRISRMLASATNGIPLGSSLLLPVCTVNCVQTLKVEAHTNALLTVLPTLG